VRVVVTIQHPAHVHFFRHAIAALDDHDHEVFVFARRNELVVDLLQRYGIDHEVLAGESDSLLQLAGVQATYEWNLLRRARVIQPDVITAIGGVAAAHVAWLVGARSVVFYDTEHATLIRRLAYPFADVVCTPDCYRASPGGETVTYPGYHELAYLHPDRFEPDRSVLAAAGVDPDEALVICRLSSWDSSHDVGQAGFDDPVDVVDRLQAAGATVQLTAEVDLPPDLESNQLSVAPHRLHDLLYCADLTMSEGATTAAESALLGTPALYVNTLELGYTTELDARYGLLYHFDGPNRHERSLERALEILDGDDAPWDRRRAALLDEKRDTTDVIVDQVARAGG